MDNIKKILNTVNTPEDGLILNKINFFYWGKSSKGDIVYGFESKNTNLIPIAQTTKYLKIFLNTKFNVLFSDTTTQKNMSLLFLKNEGIKFLDIFIRLTETIKDTISEEELLNYFLDLQNLFSNESPKSIKELQGLYGELYTMIYLKEKLNIDITKYFQSENKRKFDFSINENKKIEIKTTTLPTRIHHFKLEQLNILRYNIMITSILLQKDDSGLSLKSLIKKVRESFANNLKLLIYIESIIKNIDTDILEILKYNNTFIAENIKFFKATDVPRIEEKTMNGVFNVEFDSNLSTIKDLDENEINDWIFS